MTANRRRDWAMRSCLFTFSSVLCLTGSSAYAQSTPNQPPIAAVAEEEIIVRFGAGTPVSIENFVQMVDDGDVDKEQSVAEYVFIPNKDLLNLEEGEVPALTDISIDAEGTLHFTPAANAQEFYTFQAKVRDDGGTADGGDDLSDPVDFKIRLNTVETVVLTSIIRADTAPEYTNSDELTYRVSFNKSIKNIAPDDFYIENNTANAVVSSVTPININRKEFNVAVSGGDLAAFDGEIKLSLKRGGLEGYNEITESNVAKDDSVLDVDNNPNNNGGWSLDQKPAQTFVANQTGQLTTITVLGYTSTPEEGRTIRARLIKGDRPSGVELASTTIATSTLPIGPAFDEDNDDDIDDSAYYQNVYVTFPEPVDVEAVSKYTLVIDSEDSDTAFRVQSSGNYNYNFGKLWIYHPEMPGPGDIIVPAGWGEAAGFHMFFETFIDIGGVVVNDALPSPHESYQVDTIAPVANISSPSSSQTTYGPVTYTVEYEGASDVELSLDDIELIASDYEGDNASATLQISGSGNQQTVTLSNISGDGELGFRIKSGVFFDQVGNPNVATESGVVRVYSEKTIALDKIESYAAGVTDIPLAIEDFVAVGVSGVTEANLDLVKDALDAVEGYEADSTEKIQSIVDQVNSLLLIAAYAESQDNPAPTVSDYEKAGVQGVTDSNLADVNTLVGSGGTLQGDMQSAIQDKVTQAQAINRIKAFVENPSNQEPTLEDYLEAGLDISADDVGAMNIAIASLDPEGDDFLKQLTDTNDSINSTNTILAFINGEDIEPPVLEDYANAGFNGVTEKTLPLVNNGLKRAHADQSLGLSDIQAIINTVQLGQDDNGNGLPNFVEGAHESDTDGDGTVDTLDTDSDNDGISDIDELYALDQTDADSDGIIDLLDADIGNDGIVDEGKTDDNFDGVNDALKTFADIPGIDVDNDGVPNHRDLDSDNDSRFDIVENGGSDDNDSGTLQTPDNLISLQTLAALPESLLDDDGDNLPNCTDLTSDGSTFDIIVANFGHLDADGDGMIDNTTDEDGDGIPDVIDGAIGVHGSLKEADDNSTPDDDANDENNNKKKSSGGYAGIVAAAILSTLLMFRRRTQRSRPMR